MSDNDIGELLARERQERRAASRAASVEARDSHFMLAERFADQAWSINEAVRGLPPIPSGLWT